jgi:valyl-tRNA synthetase
MIMLGIYVTGEVPFKNVYIHGYVMAQDGSKMSKSVGNVVDPMPLIDKYGSDAVRIGLVISRSAGVNSGYDPRKIEDGRNFANKLWNLARFIESKASLDFRYSDKPKATTIQDEWILSRLAAATKQTTQLLEGYRYSEAFDSVYHLVWDDFADWYVETCKSELNLELLCYVFNNILKLVHPFAPFVSETIWQNFDWNKQYLVTSQWPKLDLETKSTAKDFNKLISLVEEVRFVKSTLGNTTIINLLSDNELVISHERLLKGLGKINSIKSSKAGQGLKLQSIDKFWVDISDSEITNFISSLTKQKDNQEIVIKNLEQRLSNKSYLEKAPEKLIEETKNDLSKAKTSLENLNKQIKNFNS